MGGLRDANYIASREVADSAYTEKIAYAAQELTKAGYLCTAGTFDIPTCRNFMGNAISVELQLVKEVCKGSGAEQIQFNMRLKRGESDFLYANPCPTMCNALTDSFRSQIVPFPVLPKPLACPPSETYGIETIAWPLQSLNVKDVLSFSSFGAANLYMRMALSTGAEAIAETTIQRCNEEMMPVDGVLLVNNKKAP